MYDMILWLTFYFWGQKTVTQGPREEITIWIFHYPDDTDYKQGPLLYLGGAEEKEEDYVYRQTNNSESEANKNI